MSQIRRKCRGRRPRCIQAAKYEDLLKNDSKAITPEEQARLDKISPRNKAAMLFILDFLEYMESVTCADDLRTNNQRPPTHKKVEYLGKVKGNENEKANEENQTSENAENPSL